MTSAPPEPIPAADLERVRSGAQGLIGYHVDLDTEDGSARITLEIAEQHRNRNGTLHGGIVTMMLDAAAGFSASRGAEGAGLVPVATVSLTTNYVAPAVSGVVTATGRLSGGGRSILYAGAELRDETGALLASASGVFKALRRKAGA
ncbi:MAG: PaaI family thioesterase [Pseudodonghicola sp.]|nr:PaaI family thioesterase [Pseudodonghicola sp.]